MSIPLAAALFAVIGFVLFAARRLLIYLHIFQQEEYDGPRFLRWLWHNGALDRRLSLAIIALFIVQLILGPSASDRLPRRPAGTRPFPRLRPARSRAPRRHGRLMEGPIVPLSGRI